MSFEEVYREHVRFVWRQVRRLGVAEADVEDVCQLVFEVVHRQLPGFRGDAKITTWLFAIVMRVVSDHRRSAYQRRVAPDHEIEVAVAPEQEGALERRQARDLLDQLLAELDDDKRAAFVLVELEHVPVKEAAEILGSPVQTIYSRVRAAREQLEGAARRIRLVRGGA
ncbi:MAG TPA: RNA polymerase sigma factor [Kofleriaceae bacterium]|nr:RNA polymerase sigma factor [Kofleriaceae bacterium]